VLQAVGRGRLAAGESYDLDTVQPVLSCTKVVTGMVVAHLVDRGVLSYNDKVVDHWPEFATFEPHRANISIADLLQHRARLPFLVQGNHQLSASWMGSLHQQHMEDWIIKGMQTEQDIADGDSCYHATSAGYILQACITRADPTGRSIGAILQEEITEPMGVKFYMGKGYPPEGCESAAQIKVPSNVWRLLNIFLPYYALKYIFRSNQKVKKVFNGLGFVRGAETMYRRGAMPFEGQRAVEQAWYNQPVTHSSEIPASNGVCNARSLAELAGVLANDGKHGKCQIIGKEAVRQMLQPGPSRTDHFLMTSHAFTTGGVDQINESVLGVDGFYGWNGWGGSLVIFSPTRRVSIALTVTGARYALSTEERWEPLVSAICYALDDPLFGGDNFFCV